MKMLDFTPKTLTLTNGHTNPCQELDRDQFEVVRREDRS
jgi:hypothetical protein